MRDERDENKYPQGVKVSEAENAAINLSRHAFHYTIYLWACPHQPCKGALWIIRLESCKATVCAERKWPGADEVRRLAIRFSKLLIYKEITSWPLTSAIEQRAEERFSRRGTDYRGGAGTDE